MPVTFEFDISSALYLIQAKKFKAFWKENEKSDEAAQQLPQAHNTGQNVWILKPTGFNRG